MRNSAGTSRAPLRSKPSLVLLAWFGVFRSLIRRLGRTGRGHTGPHALPHSNHVVPYTKCLEHENAGCSNDHYIKDRLYALGHWNEGIDEPKRDPDDDQGYHQFHDPFFIAGDPVDRMTKSGAQ